MSGLEAVLFDLDGTLTDSRLGILRCARYAFERLSEVEGRPFPLPDDSRLGWIIGPPLRGSFAKLADEKYVERLMGFYLERYETKGAFENHVYDGIPEALDALLDAGVQLHVATSKNERDALVIVEHFGLASRFKTINGAKLDGARADKTELIAYVLDRAGLKAERDRIAMVGDRKFDAIGARNLGLTAIGALWGYGEAAELRDAGADPLVAEPRLVPGAVSALFAVRR